MHIQWMWIKVVNVYYTLFSIDKYNKEITRKEDNKNGPVEWQDQGRS